MAIILLKVTLIILNFGSHNKLPFKLPKPKQKDKEGIMTKTLMLLTLNIFLFAFISNVSAEELTEAQQEVWKSVQDYWEAYKKGDIEFIVAMKQ